MNRNHTIDKPERKYREYRVIFPTTRPPQDDEITSTRNPLGGGMGQRVCVYSFTVCGFTSAVRGNRVAGYVALRNSDLAFT